MNTPTSTLDPIDLGKFAEGLNCDPDGVWRARTGEFISYPEAGNDKCFALEEDSFWFAHRNACIVSLLRRFQTTGPFFDIGGGNGCVAKAIQSAGMPVVLVEPGAGGVRNARSRGLPNVVHATLSEAKLHGASVPAIGFFDVMEHIPDEQEFLAEVSRVLSPNGHIFLTVPAGRWLWSDDDVQAGHFRRYTCAALRNTLAVGGFRPVYVSKMFSALPLPLFLLRTLPSLYGRRRLSPKSYQGLHKPKTRSLLDWVWRWEQSCVAGGRNIRIGTSCIAVAARA